MSDERGRRRTHHGRRVWQWLLPASLLFLVGWLWLREYVCWGHVEVWQIWLLCRLPLFAPPLLLLVSLVLLGRMIVEIARLESIDLADGATRWQRSLAQVGRARRGYRKLDRPERRDAAIATIGWLLVLLIPLFLFFAFQPYRLLL